MFKQTSIDFLKRYNVYQNLFKNSNVNIFKRNLSQPPNIQKEIKKEDIQNSRYTKTDKFCNSMMTVGKYTFLVASIGEFSMQNYGLSVAFLSISINTHLFQQMDEEDKEIDKK